MSAVKDAIFTVTVAPDGSSCTLIYNGKKQDFICARPLTRSFEDMLFIATTVADMFGFKNKPYIDAKSVVTSFDKEGNEEYYPVYEITETDEPRISRLPQEG
jgi:hypothetical protein